MLKAFRVIAESYSEQELARMIATGQIDRLLETAFSENVLNAAYQPVRDRIRSGVTDSVRYFVRNDLPKSGSIGIAFDSLSPHVVEAIKKLESKVLSNLASDTREAVRQRVLRGFENSETPKQVAKDLRNIIGLSPRQEEIVSNYEKALRGEGKSPLSYKLRDKRFDKSIKKGTLTEDQIQRQVSAYRERMVKWNAETNAKTAALDANKLAQKLSYEQAVSQGIIKSENLFKTWVGVMDEREREEHRAMEGQTVHWQSRYTNGEDVPGDSTYNCRCISRFVIRR